VTTRNLFNFWSDPNEQALLDELMVEVIQMYGLDMRYIPRTVVKEDQLWGEDTLSKLQGAYTLEMYIADHNGMGGMAQLGKVGFEIKDTITLLMSRSRFESVVGTPATLTRPREGDYVWIPAPFKMLFEITFVEHEVPFYQIGQRHVYQLTCEKVKYSHERITTGVADLDGVADNWSYAIDLNLSTGSGTFTAGEVVYQGSYPNATTATGVVASWANSVLKVHTVTGAFADDQQVKGSSSGAAWTLASANPRDDANDRNRMNEFLQDQAESIRDWSEVNPFSEETFDT
jgi:hypothetical protein